MMPTETEGLPAEIKDFPESARIENIFTYGDKIRAILKVPRDFLSLTRGHNSQSILIKGFQFHLYSPLQTENREDIECRAILTLLIPQDYGQAFQLYSLLCPLASGYNGKMKQQLYDILTTEIERVYSDCSSVKTKIQTDKGSKKSNWPVDDEETLRRVWQMNKERSKVVEPSFQERVGGPPLPKMPKLKHFGPVPPSNSSSKPMPKLSVYPLNPPQFKRRDIQVAPNSSRSNTSSVPKNKQNNQKNISIVTYNIVNKYFSISGNPPQQQKRKNEESKTELKDQSKRIGQSPTVNPKEVKCLTECSFPAIRLDNENTDTATNDEKLRNVFIKKYQTKEPTMNHYNRPHTTNSPEPNMTDEIERKEASWKSKKDEDSNFSLEDFNDSEYICEELQSQAGHETSELFDGTQFFSIPFSDNDGEEINSPEKPR